MLIKTKRSHRETTIIIALGLLHSRLAAVSQQRTATDRAFARRSPLLRDCDGTEK